MRLFVLAPEAMRDVVKKDVDDGRGIECQRLAQKQPANHRDPKRTPQLRPKTPAQGEREPAQQRGHGGHHDRTKAKQAGLINCIRRVLSILSLGLQRKVHHHDAVLFHDADQ